MNDQHARHHARWGRMASLFDKHQQKIAAVPDIASAVSAWGEDLNQWNRYLTRREADHNRGESTSKKEARDAAIAITSRWGRRCSVQARKAGKYSLEATLDHRPYEFERIQDGDCLTLLRAMHEGLSDNLALFAGQGLTAEVAAEIGARIQAYDGQMHRPKVKQAGEVSVGEQMVRLFPKLEEELEDIVHLLEAEFEESDPEFAAEVMAAYTLGGHTGHRYTGIEGAVRDAAGNAVSGLTITDTASKYSSVTDLSGYYKIRSLRPGRYELEVRDANNAVVRTKTVTVQRGRTMVVDWVV